jgi:tetratricopeptide (TPR) repeat protein
MGGPALNMVERLQAAADPGGILTSKETHAICDGYIRFDELEPRLLKGLPEPVPLYRAREVTHLSTWRARSARAAFPMFGRQTELALLQGWADRASAGQTTLVQIIGEGGIGKSRLAHEFVAQLGASDWNVLEIDCSPISSEAPYSTLRSLVRTLLDSSAMAPRGGPAVVTAQSMALADMGRAAVASLLDLPLPSPEWQTLEPRQRARATVDAVTRLFDLAARGQRLAILIDDFHWADSISRQVLSEPLAKLADLPLLLVLASRDRVEASFPIVPGIQTLKLPPLDEDASVSLLQSMARQASGLEEARELILQHTGGVPLFIEEVCRRLSEQRKTLHDLRLAPTSLEELGVPVSIQGTIAARIDNLPDPERGLLQAASGFGRRLRADELAAVAGMPEVQLRPHLDALEASELLFPSKRSKPDELEFAHDLIRQVAYESMLESTRQQMHCRILHSLEAANGDAEDSGDATDSLCHHSRLSKDWARTQRYAARVARRCLSGSLLREAVANFELTMEAIDRLPLSEQRERDAIDLRLESRLAFSGLGRVGRWLELAKEAASRAQAIGDAHRQVAAMAVRAAALNFHGTAEQAVNEGERAIEQACRISEPSWASYAQYGLGQALFIAGRYRSSAQTLAQAHERLSLPSAQAPTGTTVREILRLCCMMQCAAHLGLGELDQAERFRDQVQALSQPGQRPIDRIISCYCNGIFALGRHALGEARASLAEGLEAAERHEVRLFVPVISCQLGICLAEEGQLAPARSTLEACVAAAVRLGHTSARLRAEINLAGVLGRSGFVDEGLRTVRTSRAEAQLGGFASIDAEAAVIEAQLMVTGGADSAAAALERLHTGAEIAETLHARPLLDKIRSLLKQWPSVPPRHPERKPA